MNLNNRKKHFKLYKAGKIWLIAGTIFLTFVASNTLVKADTSATNPSVHTENIKIDENDSNNLMGSSDTKDDFENNEENKSLNDDKTVDGQDTLTADQSVKAVVNSNNESKPDGSTLDYSNSNNDKTEEKADNNQAKNDQVSDAKITQDNNNISTDSVNLQADGWNADHTQYTKDGQLLTGVHYIDGTYYDFDDNHNLVKNNYVQSQWGDWYMFGNDGKIVTGVTPWSGTYYYFDPTTYLRVDNNYVQSQWGLWYMFGNDGKIVSGVTPWAGTCYCFDPYTYLRIDNNYVQSQWGLWYMFGNDGKIVSGVTPWASTYYCFDPYTYLRVDNKYIQSQWGLWYMFGNDGRIVSGLTEWANSMYYFDPDTYLKVTNSWQNVGYGSAYFDGNGQMNDINLYHQWYSQLNQGMPEGCEGASLQIAASVLGRYYNLTDLYNTIGHGWNLSPYDGFYGNPWGGASNKVQTVFASAMANKLAGMVPGIRDITGAGVNDVINELRRGHAVVTWGNYDWNLSYQMDFHVMTIVGYSNGQFLISDPYAYSKREYWIPTSTWAYVNANTQAVGWNTPRSMNLVIG